MDEHTHATLSFLERAAPKLDEKQKLVSGHFYDVHCLKFEQILGSVCYMK